jgi:hypothetical protein
MYIWQALHSPLTPPRSSRRSDIATTTIAARCPSSLQTIATTPWTWSDHKLCPRESVYRYAQRTCMQCVGAFVHGHNLDMLMLRNAHDDKVTSYRYWSDFCATRYPNESTTETTRITVKVVCLISDLISKTDHRYPQRSVGTFGSQYVGTSTVISWYECKVVRR